VTTRWTGAMDMVQRYFDLKPIIKKIMKDSADDFENDDAYTITGKDTYLT
jgi:hypothetical protein